MTFEEYVAGWEAEAQIIADYKAKMKKHVDKEMSMRKAIAKSLQEALGDKLKEGMNNWELPDGRTLKFNYKVDRKIEEAEIQNARDSFEMLNDVDVTFDELLRVKYELDKKAWNGLSEAAVKAVSRMIVTKESAPELKVE